MLLEYAAQLINHDVRMSQLPGWAGKKTEWSSTRKAPVSNRTRSGNTFELGARGRSRSSRSGGRAGHLPGYRELSNC